MFSNKEPEQTAGPAHAAARGLRRFPPPIRLLALVTGLLLLWYGVIGTVLAGVEVDLSTRPGAEDLPSRGSVTVGMAARLLSQQVDERAFTPNDPIFYPTGLARRTPAFQAALVSTLSAAVNAMAQEQPTAELEEARASLGVDPGLWWLRAAMPPVGRPAERHLLEGRAALRAHNVSAAAAASSAPATPGRPQVRQAPWGAAVLGALLEAVEQEAARGDRMIQGQDEGSAAVQVARARGTAYAAAMLLRGLREDNAAAIRLSGRAARWTEAQDALDRVATDAPLVAGKDDLIRSGYALLLAGNAMRAILEGLG